MLDNAACLNNSGIHFTSRNMKFEVNTSIQAGMGVFTMYDCPSNSALEAFFLDIENTWEAAAAVSNSTSFVMSPANDAALALTIVNGSFGSSAATRWAGLPALSRSDMNSGSAHIPFLSYAPSMNSAGIYSVQFAPMQLIGDANISQLWNYGVKASDFLFSDAAFAALPNGTTLYAGQILAPPAYWNGANGARYALDVVYQTGTTGSPNGGATTCTGTGGTSILTCTSATDLSMGQRITVGSNINYKIWSVDATIGSAVLIHLASNLGTTYSTATALAFSAPVLGPEIQMATKSSAAPTTLAWSQGDFQQNSGAMANGICGWVNVAAGTPGTWTAIPCANASGQILMSQVTAGVQSTSPVCPNGTGGALTTSGCTSGSGTPTNTPAWLQYLGDGRDGAYEATAASCTASAPCFLAGDRYYTSFKVDSGAYIYGNTAATGSGLTIHSQGACTIQGTVLMNWVNNAASATQSGFLGGASGGSGGGTAAGVAGKYTTISYGGSQVAGYPAGTAGAASGGNGTNGAGLMWSPYMQRAAVNTSASSLDGLELVGGVGQQGGSSGGTGGEAGGGFVAMCASLDGTGGVVDASGGPGKPPAANSTGAGSGGGGGVVILSSQASVTTWPAVYVAGGPGGLATVPETAATGGACTSQPKATLGVTSGALSGTCTVVQAGAGCGTGTGVAWNILGGGTAGTAVINPTWSSGALASCTVTPGTSSGYTAATYTTAGTGGDGGNGWYAEFAGW